MDVYVAKYYDKPPYNKVNVKVKKKNYDYNFSIPFLGLLTNIK